METPVALARRAGSSLARPDALPWVTDFLAAAFFARSREARAVADLRLALGVLTTRRFRAGRRLGALDVAAFHGAYGVDRLRSRGRLDGEALRRGGARLLGDWFPAAWDDDARRAYGMAFETAAERDAFDPATRLSSAALGALTPPERDPAERHWGTYPAVPLPSPDAALRLLLDPPRWPDMASAGGRFTPVRPGGLAGQTFEIELVAEPAPRTVALLRGYVTCTTVETGAAAEPAVAAVARRVDGEVVPAGGRALALVVLTTHAGHVLGRAISHLVVFEDAAGEAFVRDVGCWDPLPPHLQLAYVAGGRGAQAAFWGPEDPEASMLAQLAAVTAGG